MREAGSLRVVGGWAVHPRRPITCVDEHDIPNLDAAACQALRGKNVLDVPLRNGVTWHKRSPIVQIPGSIQHNDGRNNRFRFVDAETFEARRPHHLGLRQAAEVRGSIPRLSDKTEMSK